MHDQRLLTIDHLTCGYSSFPVLHDISLNVNQGEIVCLIGANGAGKSTLLMTIFQNPKASSGSIIFNGTRLNEMATHEVARHKIALVPEGRRIFAAMSCEENLLLGSRATMNTPDPNILTNVYELFPILKKRKHQRAGTLSGGEQQMLAIGRGLMAKPKLLLLDEPSLGLAPLLVKKIFQTLSDIARSGTTIFLVEQNANQALNIANRGYVLKNGSVQFTGSGQELLDNPEVKRAYLGDDH